MFLEGDPKKADSAAFSGQGVGALIVNPPDGLDWNLHNNLPWLKTDVFMPSILLEADGESIYSTPLHVFVSRNILPAALNASLVNISAHIFHSFCLQKSLPP